MVSDEDDHKTDIGNSRVTGHIRSYPMAANVSSRIACSRQPTRAARWCRWARASRSKAAADPSILDGGGRGLRQAIKPTLFHSFLSLFSIFIPSTTLCKFSSRRCSTLAVFTFRSHRPLQLLLCRFSFRASYHRPSRMFVVDI
jgi:hypothetical protein